MYLVVGGFAANNEIHTIVLCADFERQKSLGLAPPDHPRERLRNFFFMFGCGFAAAKYKKQELWLSPRFAQALYLKRT